MRPWLVIDYMDYEYETLFFHIKHPEPPAGLFEKIMRRIDAEQKLFSARRRIFIFSIGLVGSVIALVPTFQMARTALVESGFTQFFSLIFSDSGVIASYWRNFALTLLEVLPAGVIALFLVSVFVFLGSLKFLARDIEIIFHPRAT